MRTAALRLSLSPVAIVGEGGLCLNVYTKMEKPSAAASASMQPLQRLSRSRSWNSRVPRRPASQESPSRRARVVQSSRATYPSARRGLPRSRHGSTSSNRRERAHRSNSVHKSIPRSNSSKAHRVALAEQLEFQKSLLSASRPTPAEQRPPACWQRTNARTELGTNEEARRLLAEHPPALDDLQSELVSSTQTRRDSRSGVRASVLA